MIRRLGFVLAIIALVSGAGLLLRAEPPQEVGTWASIGTAPENRIGAAAVALPDGRTLIAGGLANGTPTAAVVVFDPADSSFATAGQLLEPRAGHTATLLEDGHVLIAGGTVNELLSGDLEIFDPSTGASALVATLAELRTGHAAARIGDGKVLIAGGTGTDGVLQTAEIFDPSTGAASLTGSPLTVGRTGASATALIDGRVLIAGGNNGSQDLASAEIYNPSTDSFQATDTNLDAPRSNHTAVLLPYNNSVLIAGGTSDGVPLATADLFLPAQFPDPFTYGMGQFALTGEMAAPRSGAAGGPHIEGYAFLVGGGQPDAEVYRFATIKTDKDDYAPGEPAVITGTGWEANEEVTLLFQEDPAVHADYVLTVTADGDGNIYHDQWAPEQHDLGVRFYLMATGSRSRAQTTFTDGGVSVRTNGPSVTLNWSRFESSTTCTGTSTSGIVNPLTISTHILIPGNGGLDNNDRLSLLVDSNAPSGAGFLHWDSSGTPLTSNPVCVSGSNGNNVVPYIAVYGSEFSINNVTSSEGNAGEITFTFTVTRQNPGAAATVDYSIANGTLNPATGGGPICSVGVDYLNASGTVSFNPNQTSRPIQVTVCGDTTPEANETFFVNLSNPSTKSVITDTEGVGTITNDDAATTTTTTVQSSVNPSTYGDSVTFTATVSSTSTPTGSVNFVIDGGSLVAGTPGSTTATTATWTYTTSTLNVTGSPHSVSASYVHTGSFQDSTGSLASGQVVNARPVTLTGTRLYDGTANAGFSILTVSNAIAPDVVTVASGAATLASKNAGPQAITSIGTLALGGADAANYTLVGATGTVTITQLPVTLTGTRLYDGTTDAAFSILTISNAIVPDVVTVASGAATLASKNAGPQAITSIGTLALGGADAANYTLVGATGTVTITQLPVTLTGTRLYDGTTDAAFSILTISNAIVPDVVTVASGAATLASKNAGPQAITSIGTLALGGADAANYTLVGATGTVTITQLPVTLTGTRLYDGTTDAAFSILTISNAIVPDVVTVASGAATLASKNAGPQAITSIGTLALGGADAANYTLVGATGTVTITQLPVTLTGTRLYDGTTDAAFSILTISNAIAPDVVTVASGAATLASKNAGPQAITSIGTLALGGGDAANYTLVGATGTVTITQLPVTLTGTRLYDGAAIADFSILTVSNAIAPDVVTVASGTATLASKDVGVREITSMGTLALGGADVGNYTLTGATGSVTISPAHLTVTADNKSKVFDGFPFTAFTATITGFVNGETLATSGVTGTPSFSTTPSPPTLPGNYTIIPAVGTLTATNYDFTSFVNGLLTIGYGTCSAGYGPGGVILQPINSDGTSVYPRKGGSTIPVKFTVCDAAGVPISNPAAVFDGTTGQLTMLSAVRGTVTVINEAGDPIAIPDAAFRWTGDKWIFNMATSNLTTGNTYKFRINLALGYIDFVVGVK